MFGERFSSRVIAEGVVSGKPVAAIARELGVSRSWASREAHAPGTRELVDAITDQHREVADDRKASVGNYRFLRKLTSIAAKLAASVPPALTGGTATRREI